MLKPKTSVAAIFSGLVCLSLASPAYAYLDPGTGSIILQGIIAGVAMASLTVKMWWYKLTHFFRKTENLDMEDSEDAEDQNIEVPNQAEQGKAPSSNQG